MAPSRTKQPDVPHVQTVRVDKMAAGGDAIARLEDGRVVFVPGALPGELIDVEVVSAKRDYARGRARRVVEPSPLRSAPPCPELVRGCGGCAWQHIDADAQLALKVTIVEDALRRTGRISAPVVRPAGRVQPWAYRTSMRVAVDGDGRVGLRAASSNRVVTLPGCPVSHPLLSELLDGLRVTGADEVSLRVGVASGERSAWAEGFHVRLDGLPADVAVGPRAVVHETVAGRSLRVSAPSFFQSGPDAAELLVEAVRVACGDALSAGRLLDAYGGIGLFAATLGVESVQLVEASASACEDAVANLAHIDALVECVPIERWEPSRVPLVVADPARSGLGEQAVARLVATGAGRLVLVSCDPVSLARDARLLAAQGYVLVDSQVLDLFPQTPHVEVVSRLDLRMEELPIDRHPLTDSAP